MEPSSGMAARGFALPGGGQRRKEMVMMQQTIARYRDRAAAGAVLAEQLRKYAGQNVAVFGVGAGGVAVAAPIAVSYTHLTLPTILLV